MDTHRKVNTRGTPGRHPALIIAWLLTLGVIAGCQLPPLVSDSTKDAVRELGHTTRRAGFDSLDIWMPKKGNRHLEVLDMSFAEALLAAFEVARNVYLDVRVEYLEDRSGVAVYDSFGSIKHKLRPRIIQNEEDRTEYGILYELFSANTSGRVVKGSYSSRRRFEVAFAEFLGHAVPVKKFDRYVVSPDVGIPDRIDSTVPVQYVAFKKYLADRGVVAPFEGIWTESNGLYTLGILRTDTSPRFKYQAFVLESRRGNWRPGEVKARFSDLQSGRTSTGDYRLHSKGSIGVIWQADKNRIKGATGILNFVVDLIRDFPRGPERDFFSGVGTAWSVATNGVFVTNNHVIEDASKIYIGPRNSRVREAKVLARDEKLDLALLKVIPPFDCRPLYVSSEIVPNGVRIVVLGFPLAFTLGEELKITDGIISAQTGVQTDVTSYQISAAIQRGNSGSPVLDEYGQVIGIAVSVLKDSQTLGEQDPELVNYAIKSTYLFPLLSVAGVNVPQSNEMSGNAALSPEEISKRFSKSVQPVWIER